MAFTRLPKELNHYTKSWYTHERALRATARIQNDLSEPSYLGWAVLFLLVHVLIGVAVRTSPTFVAIHAGIVLLVCMWAALRWSPVAVTCCAAYIVGAEVLWRMTEAPLPYEVGKYAVSLVFIVALVRMGRRATWRPDALIYFLLLLPSAALLFADRDLSARTLMMRLSFNLSGPLCLCISVWFLSQQEFRAKDLLKICISVLGPLLAIGVVTVIATQGATDLSFTDESNIITSGGFGPNQVSAVLGLGALVALLLTLNQNSGPGFRIIGAVLVLLLGTQSAMTFSRGGIYSAVLALLAGLPLLAGEQRVRRILLPLSLAITVAGAWVILPRLEEFTGGKLAERFGQMQTTNRGELIRDDIQVWLDHPLLGVGPGRVSDFRADIQGSGHTEYTRLLAEHGSLGLLALLMLVSMAMQALLKSGDRLSRGHRLIFLVWALLSMLHAAMRIAAFGFVFGLAQAAFHLGRKESLRSNADVDRHELLNWNLARPLV